MTIQRAAGLSEEAIAKWLDLVESGLPDSSVETPAAPTPTAEGEGEVAADSETTLEPPLLVEPQPAAETPAIEQPPAEELTDEDNFDESELGDDEEYEDQLMADESYDDEPVDGEAIPQFFTPQDDDEEEESGTAEGQFNFPQIDVTAPVATESVAPQPDVSGNATAPPPEDQPKKKSGWRSRAKKLSE